MRPLDAGQIRRLLTPSLAQRTRRLYVRSTLVRLVVTDGTWILASCAELGVETARLARLSNRATLEGVVDRLVRWGQQAGDGWMAATTIQGRRLVASRGALPYVEEEWKRGP